MSRRSLVAAWTAEKVVPFDVEVEDVKQVKWLDELYPGVMSLDAFE
jgi:hypothetical protein